MGELWEAIKWPFIAAVVVLAHFAVALLVISLIWVGQQWVNYLWGGDEPMLFGRLPLKWLFDVIDLTILAVFVVNGFIAANDTLRKR